MAQHKKIPVVVFRRCVSIAVRTIAIVVLCLLLNGIYSYTRAHVSQTAYAATGINHQINFQGKLVNPNGTNVTNGSYSIVFSIYSVSSGGTAIWTETQTPTVTDGIFQISLGSVTTLPGSIDFNTDNIYLGIKVGADAEMTPRIQFTAVPQAFNAERLGGLTSSGYIQNGTSLQSSSNFHISGDGTADTSLTTPLLQSAASTALAITANAASTWQTTTGNLTLQAGSTGDIVINTDADSNLQITATAAPAVDQVAISNAGQAITTAGVNNLSLNFVGGAAAIEAGAERIDVTPSSTSGSTWNGLRVVQNATGPATGVTTNAIKLEGPTTGGAGTYNAINIANIGAVTTSGTATGLNITATNSQTAGTVQGININTITAGTATEYAINIGNNWDQVLRVNGVNILNTAGTYVGGIIGAASGGTNNGFTAFSGPATSTKTFTLPNANATILTTNAAVTGAQGGTGQSTTAVGDLLVGAASNTWNKLTIGGNGTCLTSNGSTAAWGSCTTLTATNGLNISSNQVGLGGTLANSTTTLTSGGTSSQIQLTSGANAPAVDQFTITNTGSTGVTAAGVNGLSVGYLGGAAAVESAAIRVDLTPGGTSGGTWSGFRLIPNATGAVSGVTENGVKIDGITTPGAGTENAITVGTGWDNILQSTNFTVTQAGGVTAVGVNAGSGLLQGTGGLTVTGTITLGSFTSNGGVLYTNGSGVVAQAAAGTATQVLHGGATPSFSAVSLTADVTGTLAAGNGGTSNAFTAFSGPATSTKTFTLPNANATILTTNAAVTGAQGGTGQSTTAVGDLLVGAASNTWNKLTIGGNGTCLTSNGTTASWGSCSSGSLTGSGTSGQIAFFNGAGTLTSESSGFGWDTTNKLLTVTGASGQTTQTTFSLSSSATGLTTGGLLNLQATGAPAASWTGSLATIEYNNADVDVDGNALKVGLLGAAAGDGTALNITTAQTGASAFALRVNDDGTYTDSTPFVVDANGNVGVGTASATSRLTVVNSTQSSGSTLNVTTTQTSVNTTDTGDTSVNITHTLTANSASNELVQRGMAIAVTNNLTGGGQVTNLRVLDLSASTNASTTTAALDNIYIGNGGATSGTVGANRGLTINSLQGTSQAGVVVNNLTTGTNNTLLLLGTTTIPSGNYGIYNSSTNNSYFAGNVGIGTSGPNAPLEAKLGASDGIRISGATTSTAFNERGLYLTTDSTATNNTTHKFSPYMYQSASIWNGASAVTKSLGFQVQGISGTNSAYLLSVQSTDLANIFNIRGDTGNVGIGTTTPAQKLDVNGSIGFSNNIIQTSSANASIDISGTSTGRSVRLVTSTTGSSIYGFGSTSNSLTLGAGASSHLVIDSSGNTTLNGDVTIASGKNFLTAKGTDFSTTGTSNNVVLAGALIRLTGASAQTITGISAGTAASDGRQLTLINAAGQAATLSNNSGSSSAGNQIITGSGSDLTLSAGASISLIYEWSGSAATSFWRVIGSSGGGSTLTATNGLNIASNQIGLGGNLANSTTTLTGNTSSQILLTSSTNVPVVDQFVISNTSSSGVTTAGVNGLSVAYKGGAAAVESAAVRIDLTPGTTSGGTWSGFRLIPNATGAVSGVTENGVKIDNLTTPGAGTENALFVGTGWDNVLTVNSTAILNTSGVLLSAGFSGTYSNAVTLSNASNAITAGTLTATGGTINGTSVGATTASTGAFTTLTSTSTTTLASGGGSAATIGNNTGNTTINGGTTTTAVVINTGSGGEINVGDNAVNKRVDIGGVDNSGQDTVNIATNATASDTVTIGSTHASSIATFNGGGYNLNIRNTGVGINATAPTTGTVDLFFGNGANRMININTASSGSGNSLTVQAGKGASGSLGGDLILQAGANGTAAGTPGSVTVKANGGESASAFIVQNSSGNQIFGVDTTSTGQVFIGRSGTAGKLVVYGSTNSITITAGATAAYTLTLPTTAGSNGQCLVNSGSGVTTWGTCTVLAGTNTVTLVPEFPGAVITPDGSNNSGTMSADSTLSAGVLSSGQGYKHNYYEWSTDQASAQDYDIYINYQLPNTFSSFTASSWKLWTYADSLTSTDVNYNIKDVDGTDCYATTQSAKPSSGATWQQITLTTPGNGCTFAAGEIITIVIHPVAITPQTNKVRVGELSFGY